MHFVARKGNMLEIIKDQLTSLQKNTHEDPDWNLDVIAIYVALLILIEHKGKIPRLPKDTNKHLANQLVVDLTPKLDRIFSPNDGWRVVCDILEKVRTHKPAGH